MKLYYTKVYLDFPGNINHRPYTTVTVCHNGICVDRTYTCDCKGNKKARGLTENCLSRITTGENKVTPEQGMETLLTTNLSDGESGYLFGQWEDGARSERTSYPESSLFARHPTATEYHPGDKIELYYSGNLRFFCTPPDKAHFITFIVACDGAAEVERINLLEKFDGSDEYQCDFIFDDWELFYDSARDGFGDDESRQIPLQKALEAYPNATEFDETHRLPLSYRAIPEKFDMKLYYTTTPDDLYTLSVIACIGGICVEETVDFVYSQHSGSLSLDGYKDYYGSGCTLPLDDCMELLLQEQTIDPENHKYSSYLLDFWNDAHEDPDQAYPESELLTRHPDAVLFTPGQSVHLNIPTED